jgi:DNA modification methylase
LGTDYHHPPPGGIVLDPLCGSGSTCIATKLEGFHYIGIDNNEEYLAMARKRLGVPTITEWLGGKGATA